MKKCTERIIFIFVVFCCAQVSFAQGTKKASGVPEVNAQLDKRNVTIGDTIKYTITVLTHSDTEVAFPDFGNNLGDFAIKDFGLEKKSFLGKQKLIQWYVLDTFVTGKLPIPKAIIKYKRKADTDWLHIESQALSVEVKSLLPEKGGFNDIQDIAKPVPVPSRAKPFVTIIILILILAALASALFFLKNKIIPEKVAAKSAWETAIEQLESLSKRDFIGQGKIKEYYIEISNIIRQYLEKRFHLNAPEMTTEEFLNNARKSAQLQGGHRALLGEFLTACDLVKFARYVPVLDEMNSIFDSARRFIDQTKEEPAS